MVERTREVNRYESTEGGISTRLADTGVKVVVEALGIAIAAYKHAGTLPTGRRTVWLILQVSTQMRCNSLMFDVVHIQF